MFDPRNTTPSSDTNIVPRTPPITLKDLLLSSKNDEYEVSYGSTFDLDAAPDSPCTLLGDEVDPDESCSPLSLNSSSEHFIAETPPGSPCTLFGDSNDLDEIQSPTPSRFSSGNSHAQDQPGSPSTILGDYIDTDRAQMYPAKLSSSDVFTQPFNDQNDPQSPSTVLGTETGRETVKNVSSNPGLPSPDNYPEESESNDVINNSLQDSAPPNQPARASRYYVQWPGFMCDAVPLVDKWPAFIIEAFIEEDWRFGLDEKGRTVLELISGRRDLEMWFTDMSKKMRFS